VREEGQPAYLLNAVATPALSGSVILMVTFWASSVSSLVCAIIVSNCFRACAVDSSTNSDGDFTPSSCWACSKAALVLVRATSMILRLYSVAPLAAVA
jgi:hypothetical protein